MSDPQLERENIRYQHELALEKSRIEFDYKIIEIRANQLHDLSKFAKSSAKEYGIMFCRTMILLNGGTIAALLTFLVNLTGKSAAHNAINIGNFFWPILFYISGLVSVLIIFAFSFLNFTKSAQMYQIYIDKHLSPDFLYPEGFESSGKKFVNLSFKLAVSLALVSITGFVVGSLTTLLKLASL